MADRPISVGPVPSSPIYASVPTNDNELLPHPQAPFRDSYRSSVYSGMSGLSSPDGSRIGFTTGTVEKPEDYEHRPIPLRTRGSKKKSTVWFIALGLVLFVAAAVLLPVYFLVIRKKGSDSGASSGGSSTNDPQPTAGPDTPSDEAILGGDGSTVKATDGSTFVYENKFGGIWYHDPKDPYSDNAYPNEWSPPLNKTWDYNKDRIFGVNLGGWFVLEPFISPGLFQKYPGTSDEWTLSEAMAADAAGGGLDQLETHYKTFITEKDIAEIAAAGLNWIRLPVPFWAIDKLPEEPFLEKTSWKYIVQALSWCKKYGIRVKLDLHAIPGSQNGYNHSGKLGSTNFLRGTMGMANAQRALNYIRVFTEFISQPEWRNVVLIFGIMNEPSMDQIGQPALQAFNYEVYKMIRGITGVGEGKGPYVSIFHGFAPMSRWTGFLTGADRLMMDNHPYLCFGGVSRDPFDVGTGPNAGGTWPGKTCDWGPDIRRSRNDFGVTIMGEWSLGWNDCGLFLRGTLPNQRSQYGDCDGWNDYRGFSDGVKAGLRRLALAQMDVFGDWFFWTWRIGDSVRGRVEAPFWSYKLGLSEGWMPKDPRAAAGACGAPSTYNFRPWMTGGQGAGVITDTNQYPFPDTLNDAPGSSSQLPVYSLTGTINPLPGTNSSGNGWTSPGDTWNMPVAIPGCQYPNSWDAQNAAVPSGCTTTNPFPRFPVPSA